MENSVENKEKKVVSGIEFSSDGGLITWREIYTDGSDGNWEGTNIETNDLQRLKKLREDLQEEYGDEVKI
jgi:hypothetical protein